MSEDQPISFCPACRGYHAGHESCVAKPRESKRTFPRSSEEAFCPACGEYHTNEAGCKANPGFPLVAVAITQKS